ncbi:hypothetical protein CsSME_00017887 [Camellia sinensis var. sinensis]
MDRRRTDAKIGGDDSSVAAVEKVGASYRYTDDMELNDAVHTAILTLKEGVLTPSEIADYLEEVE